MIRNFAALMVASMIAVLGFSQAAFAVDTRTQIVQKASVSAAAASGVTSGATTVTTVTVPGAALGDACIASHSVDSTGITHSCIITAANTAKVYSTNFTTNGVALSSGTLRVFVIPKGTR